MTHVNDGFNFLGHRIIRKRGPRGTMRVVSTIPWEKAKNFRASLAAMLSGSYSESKVEVVRRLNARLRGWLNFYRFVDYRAIVFRHIDRVVFWKLAYWMARKYRCRIKPILVQRARNIDPNGLSAWCVYDTVNGQHRRASLLKLVGHGKMPFRFGGPDVNPYLRTDEHTSISSRYRDAAFAFASA